MECKIADYVEAHGISILECIRAWTNTSRTECRTFHVIGDGTFVADGEKFDFCKEMATKLPPL